LALDKDFARKPPCVKRDLIGPMYHRRLPRVLLDMVTREARFQRILQGIGDGYQREKGNVVACRNLPLWFMNGLRLRCIGKGDGMNKTAS
jgi:hypothetical protein